MHAKFVALSALFTLVAAGGYGPPTGNNNDNNRHPDHPNHDNHDGQNKPVEGKCNVGEMQCCNSVKSANDQGVTSILSLLGIGAGGVTGMVGLTCSPISALAIGGNSCNAQPVCCENNNFNGVVALGCNPINAGL